ncbi:hypothetical protein A1Q2_00563 [Trichosporon asahii var. asahii CBS 8904]|uniref:Uncharacterized protein n=2 Tax=Trichosporon asahii var. asahii TaxID=189963 RepID=K1W039_TRIAC|nr:hypothetical protein A1Q1_03975 [Trichosporon asahii var. asahii CBS 2479]EJT52459.1 hypothetical protein A1Q1_03975 [Trichosporon asahii var. asahii CBS 2479]EKD05142.1 hypothetical protein A1Q2_00563 [Trichosporon asahii var. asahii CBS 8904]
MQSPARVVEHLHNLPTKRVDVRLPPHQVDLDVLDPLRLRLILALPLLLMAAPPILNSADEAVLEAAALLTLRALRRNGHEGIPSLHTDHDPWIAPRGSPRDHFDELAKRRVPVEVAGLDLIPPSEGGENQVRVRAVDAPADRRQGTEWRSPRAPSRRASKSVRGVDLDHAHIGAVQATEEEERPPPRRECRSRVVEESPQ